MANPTQGAGFPDRADVKPASQTHLQGRSVVRTACIITTETIRPRLGGTSARRSATENPSNYEKNDLLPL